jgi:protoheme IX farnesyltransferase
MKPGIVSAVLLTGFAGMVLAQRGWPDPGTALVCLTSLFLAAAGSALLNVLLDLPLDARMARLRRRVAALETVGRKRVLTMALIAIAVALTLAFHCLNLLTFLLTLAAVLFYTLLYTLHLKRRSPWGAVTGGIPGALPVLIGYAATVHPLDLDGLILFMVMLLWQPPHFWALALHHTDDYRAAGIPVLPVTHGEDRTRFLIFVFAALLLPASLSLSLWGDRSFPFAGAALLLWGLFIVSLVHTTVRRQRYDQAFRCSILYLAALLISVITSVCGG